MRLGSGSRKVALPHHGRSTHDEGMLGGKAGHLDHEPGCHLGRIEGKLISVV
jgi:hypothetical protein